MSIYNNNTIYQYITARSANSIRIKYSNTSKLFFVIINYSYY